MYKTLHHEEIRPPPPDVIQAAGLPPEYHSDSADSLNEVTTTIKSRSKKHMLSDSKSIVDSSPDLNDSTKRKKQKRKKIAQINPESEIIANPNSLVNGNTAISLDPIHSKRRPLDVPPLDFSGLKSSSESLSFKPYSALRSSDTFRTDRVMHPWPERTVIDTEV